MGLFSKIFGGSKSSGIISGRNPGNGWITANRFNKAKGGFAGGYGAITFGNIMKAHCDTSEIVEEFGLDKEGCDIINPTFGCNCYIQAYTEAYQIAQIEINALTGLGIEMKIEELIDLDAVQLQATEYAEELAEMFVQGRTWIPSDMLEWAYYDVSDHNR